MEGLPIRQRYTLRSQQGATDSENSDENKENSQQVTFRYALRSRLQSENTDPETENKENHYPLPFQPSKPKMAKRAFGEELPTQTIKTFRPVLKSIQNQNQQKFVNILQQPKRKSFTLAQYEPFQIKDKKDNKENKQPLSILTENKENQIILTEKEFKIPLMEIEYQDPQLVPSYQTDILSYLSTLNWETPLLQQPNLNSTYWIKLADWLIQILDSFKMSQETLHRTFALMIVYLKKRQIELKHFQLVAITCVLMASKLHECQAVQVKELVYACMKHYTEDDIRNQEADIANALEFNLSFPTLYEFFQIYAQKYIVIKKHYYICLYFLDICLLDPRMKNFSQEVLALATIYFVIKLHHLPATVYDFPYEEGEIKQCAHKLLEVYQDRNQFHNFIEKKFGTEQFMHASRIYISNQ